jgi:hypothetical protein
MRLLQSLRAQAAAGSSLLLLHFPFVFLSIGSSVFLAAVSAATVVTAVVISIAISIGALHLISAAPRVSRPLLSLPVTSVMTSVKHLPYRVVLVIS